MHIYIYIYINVHMQILYMYLNTGRSTGCKLGPAVASVASAAWARQQTAAAVAPAPWLTALPAAP